jgi:hypothetical protein
MKMIQAKIQPCVVEQAFALLRMRDIAVRCQKVLSCSLATKES